MKSPTYYSIVDWAANSITGNSDRLQNFRAPGNSLVGERIFVILFSFFDRGEFVVEWTKHVLLSFSRLTNFLRPESFSPTSLLTISINKKIRKFQSTTAPPKKRILYKSTIDSIG